MSTADHCLWAIVLNEGEGIGVAGIIAPGWLECN